MSALIRVVLSRKELQIEPGQKGEIVVTIHNLSEIVDQYSVEVEGLNEAWFTISPASVSLFPQDQGKVTVSIQPPAGSESRAANYDFTLRVVSREMPAERASLQVTLTVLPQVGFELSLSPQRQSTTAAGSFRVKLNNPGNVDLTVDLEATDPEEGCLYSFRPGKATVRAGQSLEVPLVVTPKSKPPQGGTKRYDFTVKATPSAPPLPAKQVSGQLEQQVPRPRRLWPVLLIALLLFGCGAVAGLAYLFRGNIRTLVGGAGRSTPTSQVAQTAAAQTALAEANAATQTAVALQTTQAAQAAGATQTALAGANAATQTAVAAQATKTAQAAGAIQTAQAGANLATQTAVAAQATKTAQAAGATQTAQAAATQTARAASTLTAQAGGTPIVRVVTPIIARPITLIVPRIVVVYDFIARADKASYASGAGALPWPGASGDSRGLARWLDNASLEDGSTATKVLETVPQAVGNGYIEGVFVDVYQSGYVVDAKDYFVGTVGLLKNATGGSVTFRVMIRVQGVGNIWIANVSDTYDGSLKNIEIPLSTWAGKPADFILRVEAGPSVGNDWAIWSKARIERR